MHLRFFFYVLVRVARCRRTPRLRLTIALAAALVGLTLSGARAQAQVPSAVPQSGGDALGIDTVAVHRDTLRAAAPQPFTLRPFVLRETVRVLRNGRPIPPAAVNVEAVPGYLWVRPFERLERTDTLVVHYQTLPVDLQTVYRRRTIDSTRAAQVPSAQAPFAQAPSAGDPAPQDTSARDTSARAMDPFAPQGNGDPSRPGTGAASATADTLDRGGYVVVEEGDRDSTRAFDPFTGVDLQRSGSISRGVTGGSNQDAGIESGLRLQMEGNLTESVAVRALLTDQNTPIQPEGTTQRLDDFDRVFIELETPQATLQLGDVDVAFSGTEFGAFSRKIQGATLRSQAWGPALGLAQGEATALGAVSRGQYRTQDLQPIDGVQGPYRLSGAQGERFVVIVAGSERVYLDGQRLERGRTNDYTIDYTRAEITFTPNRIITEDRRITVEFQYRTSQFDRTLVGGRSRTGIWSNDAGRPRVQIGATFLREADGQDFGAAFNLSPQDSLALVNAGDDLALRSAARRVEFDAESPFIPYRQEVRTTPTGTDTVFVALEEAPPEGAPVFRVDFSRVGPGNGAYARVGRQQNGILYEYRGEGQGDYSPIQPIPRPQKQQLLDLTGQVEPVEGVQVYGEWAQSVNDANRFSSLDASNDVGTGFLAGVRILPVRIEAGRTSLGTVSANVNRRRRGQTFQTFDQTRSIDFNREWNLSRTGSGPSEAIASGGEEVVDRAEVQWQPTERSSVTMDLGRLGFGNVFEADRIGGRAVLGEAGVPRMRLSARRIASTDRVAGTEGTWTQQVYAIRQPLGPVEPSLEVEREVRDQQNTDTGAATSGAFAFTEWTPGARVSGGAWEVDGALAYRLEDETLDGRTRRAARAVTAQTTASYAPTAPFDVSVQGGYRVRRFTEAFADAGRRDTESILINVDAGTQPWRRAVDARLFYDARTEREPTLQEVYVRTGVELGQFVWRDENGDGLQQVDEFVPETTPNEGAYVQSFVPSDSLASVVSIDTRLRARLEPARIWRRSTSRLKRWLARVETRSVVEVQEKSRSGALAKLYLLNPSVLRQEGRTIDGTLRLQQEVQLFPNSRVAGVDGGWTQSRGLRERAAGQETQFLNAWEVETRVRPAAAWTARLSGSVQTDRVISEAFTEARTYDILARQIRPELTYRPATAWRMTGAAAVAQKDDAARNRTARVIRLPAEIEWARGGRFRIAVNGELADIDLDGEAVGLAQFELTDGRGAGRSYLWGARGQYQVSGNIRATFAYDGRAPADAPTIHTFRINVSAQF